MKFVTLLLFLVQAPFRRFRSFEDIPGAFHMHFQDFLQTPIYLSLD